MHNTREALKRQTSPVWLLIWALVIATAAWMDNRAEQPPPFEIEEVTE